MRYSLLTLCCALGLCACGLSEHAGTNTSETQNAIHISLRMSDGTPAALAQIQVCSLATWQSNIQHGKSPYSRILVADSNGTILLAKNAWSGHGFWVQANGEARYQNTQDSLPDSIWQLGPPITKQGVLSMLDGSSGAGRKIFLQGTTQATTTDNTGHYQFSALPNGDYTPVLNGSAADSANWTLLPQVTLSVQAVNSRLLVDSILVTSQSLLLDNFDAGNDYGLLHLWTRSSYWWSFIADSANVIDPSSTTTFLSDLLPVAQGGYSGLSLRVRTSYTGVSVDSVSMIGFDFGTGSNNLTSQFAWADLRGASSIRLYAKGSGMLYVMLKTKAVFALGDNQNFYKPIQLTSTWTLYDIPLDSLQTFPSSAAHAAGLHWKDVSSRVSSLLLQSSVASEFWLDNISIEGLTGLQFHSDGN